MDFSLCTYIKKIHFIKFLHRDYLTFSAVIPILSKMGRKSLKNGENTSADCCRIDRFGIDSVSGSL